MEYSLKNGRNCHMSSPLQGEYEGLRHLKTNRTLSAATAKILATKNGCMWKACFHLGEHIKNSTKLDLHQNQKKWRLYYHEVARYSTYHMKSACFVKVLWFMLITPSIVGCFWETFTLGSLTDTLPAAVTRISSSAFWTSSLKKHRDLRWDVVKSPLGVNLKRDPRLKPP